MKEYTCCFSGHRKLPILKYLRIRFKTYREICRLIETGVIYFGCGGAIGFDTLAAKCVLKAKKKYPHIKLIMVYPCKDQTLYWSKKNKRSYEIIKSQCDKYIYITEKYSFDCMYKRNKHLVDNSNYCICYLTQQKGGTYQTVNYAYKKGLTVINI